MSIRNKLTGVVASLALLATVGIAANGQQATTTDKAAPHSEDGGIRKGGRRRQHGMSMFRVLRDLNLTDSQKDQARAIVERLKANIEPQRQALMELHKQREQGTVSDDVREKAMSLRGEIKTSMKGAHEELLTILTAEQRAQFDKMQAERKARHDERRSRRAMRKSGQAPAEPAAQ